MNNMLQTYGASKQTCEDDLPMKRWKGIWIINKKRGMRYPQQQSCLIPEVRLAFEPMQNSLELLPAAPSLFWKKQHGGWTNKHRDLTIKTRLVWLVYLFIGCGDKPINTTWGLPVDLSVNRIHPAMYWLINGHILIERKWASAGYLSWSVNTLYVSKICLNQTLLYEHTMIYIYIIKTWRMFIGCWTTGPLRRISPNNYIYILPYLHGFVWKYATPQSMGSCSEFGACSSLPADQSCALLRARTWRGWKTLLDVFCCGWKSLEKGMDVDGMWNLVTIRLW